ncbi:MAG: S-layer homology domain-containing protein [Firmicutes bacterium]|nr:S-layer homology domain-containing protein [Bacillota bacterium]
MRNKLKMILTALLVIALSTSAAFAASVPADVAGKSCEDAVEKLVDEGIITGDTDGLFHPEDNLTRAQVSIMIAKAIDPDVVADQDAAVVADFSDMAGYDWAAGAIGLMVDREIAKGYPDGTFKPGSDVSVAELITFTMRASGYEDEALQDDIWPYNFINAAKEIGLSVDDSGKDLQKTKATKEQAAVIIYEALDFIKEEAKKYEAEQAVEGFVYGSILFDANITSVNGKALASDVKVYPYEKKKNYSADMQLPDVTKLITDSVYKYKNVSTVGFYKVENNKVTAIILPRDAGFSGTVYGVINEANSVIVKGEGELTELVTLAAGKELSWFSTIVPAIDPATVEAYIEFGYLIEMRASKGKITNRKVMDEHYTPEGKLYFADLGETIQTEGGLAVEEKNKDRKVLKLSNGEYIAYRDTTVVYVLNEDGDAYEVGSMSDVRDDNYIRAYDITDDDEEEADIIIVSKNKFAVTPLS